jgi:integrase
MHMASVHKIQRSEGNSSKFFYARFRGSDGTDYCKSTKKTKRAEALVVAMEFERMARGHTTESHYRRVASELFERTAGRPLNFHSAGEWLDEWLRNTKPTVQPRTYERYEGTIKDFREFLGDRTSAPLAAITPEEVISYRDTLIARGLASSTVNLAVRKTLGAPFEAARRLGYITVNPCAAVKSVKDSVPKSKARRQPFTAQQIEALLDTSRDERWKDTGWEGAILCGMTTALRLGDIVDMRWGRIDLDTKTLTTPTKKTGDELTIPLHPSFTAWLGKQTRGIGNAPVFSKLQGKKIGGANGLSRKFKKLMEDAGVFGEIIRRGGTNDQRKKNHTSAGRTVSTLSFHSLRHTATSLMANAGVAADTRKAITGHRDDRVHENYTHHQIEKLREAVGLIAVPGAAEETPAAGENTRQKQSNAAKKRR